MNYDKIKEVIKVYKEHFQAAHNSEIYKWKATKQFQDYWNPDADDYRSMLENALKYLTGASVPNWRKCSLPQ